ncbi:LacI family transcriptional regulator [Arcticibacter pallidicorallinus]|uniref:LacI family transcriptional regulator n=1 Tax=Arcticibacter pallidicorallinus TaxID=1259464 RepID=A0A2T0U9G9_9SPHI|nr:substrate-binding domain-containing protein [Arcticibacter pallidicorallinus]PRY54566.1 LacI family transcriptional regulator [Arcticibacter pallidicorallinus]
MDSKKDIRIVDIARMAGVSIGTVDRVIHKRGRVSEESLKKVNAVLSMVNYSPNIFARSLVSKKNYKVVALIPQHSTDDYWMYISEGLERASEEAKSSGIAFERLYFNQYDRASFEKSIERLLTLDVDGVIIANFFSSEVVRISKALDVRNIPYVYIDANIEDQNPLAYFGTHSYDSGAVAARIISGRIGQKEDILIAKMFHNSKELSNQVLSRQKGFLDYIERSAFAGKIYYADLKIDAHIRNFEALDKIFDEQTGHSIRAAITFNSTCHVLANYLKVRDRKLTYLVGYDLIEKNKVLLKEGYIDLLIGQRPELQGYRALKVITDKLLLNLQSEKINYMPIDLLIKENIDYYQNL